MIKSRIIVTGATAAKIRDSVPTRDLVRASLRPPITRQPNL